MFSYPQFYQVNAGLSEATGGCGWAFVLFDRFRPLSMTEEERQLGCAAESQSEAARAGFEYRTIRGLRFT